MADPIILNEVARLDGAFRDHDGALTDVAGLAVDVRRPDLTTAVYSGGSVLHDGTGLYHLLHPTDAIGTHLVRWRVGSTVMFEDDFYVYESSFDLPEDWQPITAAEVEANSQLDLGSLGLTPRRLQATVDSALAWIEWVTGRTLDSTLPVGLQPIARETVRQRVELGAFRGGGDAVQTAGTEGIASMSVGGVSLTFRDPARPAGGSGGVAGIPMITPWALLNENLWVLMTDAQRDYWIARFSGNVVPSFAITEPDFSWPSESSHGVRTGDFPWDPFGPGPPGWPGWGWD